jgi:acyl carrier protein
MTTTELGIDPRTFRQRIFDKVCEQLATLGTPGIDYLSLGETAHLIDEIGLDSLKFVDLTVRLEEAFGLSEFPMQEWIDEQLASGRPLTLGELVRACEASLQ